MKHIIQTVAATACLTNFHLAVLAFSASAAPETASAEEKIFAEMKVYDSAGRPWRSAKEDWANAKRLVAEDSAWGGWLADRRDVVDRWMAKFPQDRVEWTDGRLSHFFSPKDGTNLTWDDRIPGVDVDHFSSPTDPRVEITPQLMGAWVNQFRRQHIRTISEAARLYRLTGEDRYAEWAMRQIQFYADNYSKWPVSTNADKKTGQLGGTRIFYTGLDTAVQMFSFIDAVRLLGDRVTSEIRAQWEKDFFRPDAMALENHFFGKTANNVALWQWSAAATYALAFGDKEMWKRAVDGEFGVRSQLASGITGDFVWHEQTFGYNSYVINAAKNLFLAADLRGRGDDFAREKTMIGNIMLCPVYLRFPGGYLPGIADTPRDKTKIPDPALLVSTYRFFPTSAGLSAANGERNWDTLLDPPAPAPADDDNLPNVKSRHLSASGMALLKSGKWQVFFHYSQLTLVHAQDEVIGFEAFYGDTDITHNSGTVKYGTSLHRDYFTRAASHNIPVINGLGQQKRPTTGEMVRFSEDPPAMSARVDLYRDNASVTRTLEIVEGNLVDSVDIRSRVPSSNLGLILHLQGKVQLPAEFLPDQAFGKDLPPAFSYWQNARRAKFKDRAEFQVEYTDGLRMKVVVEVPGEFSLIHASAPDTPLPARRDVLFMEVEGRTHVNFRTTFIPDTRVQR